MSPREKIPKKVLRPPIVRGFKPFGQDLKKGRKYMISMLFEEYEALRLSDYEMLNHHQASVEMKVSRPTFTRVYWWWSWTGEAIKVR